MRDDHALDGQNSLLRHDTTGLVGYKTYRQARRQLILHDLDEHGYNSGSDEHVAVCGRSDEILQKCNESLDKFKWWLG